MLHRSTPGVNRVSAVKIHAAYPPKGTKHVGVPPGRFPWSFDISPGVDYAGLGASMGAPGVRVVSSAEVEPAAERMLAEDGPFLLHIEADGSNRTIR